MEILLLRHGIAAGANELGCEDAERPLTQEGIEKMRAAAAGMAGILDGIDLVLSSPLRRARETAEIVAAQFKGVGAVVECEELALGSSGKRMLSLLAEHSGRKRVLLVSHEPELAELYSILTGARSSSVNIKKGALLCIALTELGSSPKGVLQWHLTSKQLRAIEQ